VTTLAVDLGGTQMRAALVADDGTVVVREVRPTPARDPEPHAFVALLRDVAARGAPDRAVIGIPGRVDHAHGRLDHAPNLPASWTPFLTEAALGDAVSLPVALANDADLAAVGEGYFGAGVGHPDLVYVTLSTGVGAGVLLGGRLVRGRRSAVEAGHHVIDQVAFARGEPCTFEQLASGTALGRRARSAGLDLPGPDVVKRGVAGEPVAKAVLADLAAAAAVGVRNLCFLFSPSRVVLGGGLGLSGEWLYGPIREHLARSGPPAMDIDVVPAALGDAAGLVGAAAWARAS
jgi:glucokinase